MSEVLPTYNTNSFFPLAGTSFVVQFSRMPNLTFAAQEVQIPGVGGTPTKMGLPGVAIHSVPDRLNYEPLTVNFLVDEELTVHREIHNWLVGSSGGVARANTVAGFVAEHEDYIWPDSDSRKTFIRTATSSAVISILNASKIPIYKVVFFNVLPTALGAVNFSTTITDPNIPLTAQATFIYDYYEILKLNR